MGHPLVAEAAVVGVAHSKWGQVPRAYVVLRGTSETTTAEGLSEQLRAYCRERLAKFKAPESFVFVTSLPRTGAGKVDKKQLV